MQSTAVELVTLVEAVYAKLSSIEDQDASAKPDAESWSQKEIIGHLIDSATNNHHRFIRAQLVDPLIFPAYQQEAWVKLNDYQTAPWDQLIQLWRSYNLLLAHLIDRIPADMGQRLCTIGGDAPVTLQFLVEDYLGHMRLHVEQLGY